MQLFTSEKNVHNVQICTYCNHFAITLNEFYHNTQSNNLESLLKVHFSKNFFRKNIGFFTDLHNEKKSFLKVCENGIITVSGNHVNIYKIL